MATTTTNKSLIYLTILAVVFIIAYAFTYDGKVAMLGDNANYYMLGQALSQGEGYINIARAHKSPNNHYPPGYPAIIAVALTLGANIFSIKLLNGLFLLLSTYVFYEVIKRLLSAELAFVSCLLLILNSHILLYSSIMMSEVPFMFFSGLSILLFIKASESDFSFKDPKFIGALLSMLVAYHIRSLGIAIFAGFFLHFILSKKWKPLAILFGAQVAGAMPWFIRGNNLGGSSYVKQLTMVNPYQPNLGEATMGDFVDRFISNLGRYITYEIPSAIFPFKNPTYGNDASTGEWFLGLALLALGVFGLLKLRQYKWVLIGYALGTFGVLMIWPSVWIGVRFIVPFIPVLLVGFVNGLHEVIQIIIKSAGRKSFNPLFLTMLFVFSFSPINSLNTSAKADYSPAWENYFKMAKWVNKNLDDGVIISCGKPALFYLEAQTFTMRYKFASDPAQLIDDLEEKEVDYVVVDQVYGNTFRYLVPAIRQNPQRFEQVLHLKNPDTYLLKFKSQK